MRASFGVVVCPSRGLHRADRSGCPIRSFRRANPERFSSRHPSRGASGAGAVTLVDQAGIGARSSDLVLAIGQEKLLELYTHCGIDFDVDFDGSFWQLYPDSKTRGLANPFQRQTGTMTLLSDRVAVFHFEHQDEQRAVYFVRNDSPKPLAGCA